jgi:hypothetical protein
MATSLDKTLKREVRIGSRSYIVAISPLTLKLTPKGKRRGLELDWESLVSGDAALAAALNASVGRLTADAPADAVPPAREPNQQLTRGTRRVSQSRNR